ncbi:hypothetical protein GCM10010372_21640 [Streptomyces tauricus]|nr:hypothetical protein GCM10010372_21640 [Streptomyces tauricus]
MRSPPPRPSLSPWFSAGETTPTVARPPSDADAVAVAVAVAVAASVGVGASNAEAVSAAPHSPAAVHLRNRRA